MTRKVQIVSDDAYEWGRRELNRRDRDVAACRNYDGYEAMRKEWDLRAERAGLSRHVRKQVIRAAVDERREKREMPWLRNAS